MAVNFTATYNSVAVCLPHMLEHGEGSQIVVHVVDERAAAGRNLGVYTATKIAVVGLMEALRVELEGTTVGTSAFVPGGVNTDNYFGTGRRESVSRGAGECAAGGQPPPRNGPPPGMDPLEAGERVLNGVIHNDLFIVTHPEYMPGTKERFDAMLASEPVEDTPPPEARVKGRGARAARRHLSARDRASAEEAQVLPQRHGLSGAHRHDSKNRQEADPTPRCGCRSIAASSSVAGAALGTGAAARRTRARSDAVAQNAPAPRRRQRLRRARPAPPPEPTVSQPPPLKDLKGKVAYITAASDGIGLGIARAALERGHEGGHRLSQRRAPEGRTAAVQAGQRGRARRSSTT